VVAVRDRFAVAALLCFLVTISACSAGSPTPHGGVTSPAPAPLAVARAAPGWPVPRATYLGRYRMTWSSDPAFARTGLLTLFMRPVTQGGRGAGAPHAGGLPKAMNVPSGIISVVSSDATTVLYLTKFGHLGSRAVADVNLGLYTSSPVGAVQLTAFSAASHTLTLVFSAPGERPVQLRFTRYSADPHP
jgi:hypothetical protein